MESWEERCREAERLAPCAGDPEVDKRLIALLLDPENTAVSQAAADPLLARRDIRGLAVYAAAFARAYDDTRNKLGDCLYDDDGTLWGDVRRMMPRLEEHPSADVRHGVAILASHMLEEEKHHRLSP